MTTLQSVEDYVYSESREYKKRIEDLEFQCEWGATEEIRENALREECNLLIRYGAPTKASRYLLHTILERRERVIMFGLDLGNGQAETNLDNETDIQAESAPCEEKGESSMASKFRGSYTYVDENGAEQHISFNASSKKEADKKFQLFLAGEKAQKQPVQTVKEFIDSTFRPVFIENNAPTTVANYEQYIKCNIVPFMGEMPMDKVTVTTIQKFQNWMAEGKKHGKKKNLNAGTIKRVCSLVSRIFKVAVEMRLIDDNPVKNTLLKNPGEPSDHHKALSVAESKRVFRETPSLSNEQERLYMALLVYTGMRKEEILGLRWEDINFPETYAEIKQAVTYPTNNHPCIGKPKTKKSKRTVPLVPPLMEVLESVRKETGYVLGGDQPLCYSTAYRIRHRAFEKLNIVGYDNHDFRANMATVLREYGMSESKISEVLGHADTRMVYTVYAPSRHEGVMKHLAGMERAIKSLCDAG